MTGALSKTNYGFARSSYFFFFCFLVGWSNQPKRGILMVAEKHGYAVVKVFSVNRGLGYLNYYSFTVNPGYDVAIFIILILIVTRA